MSKVGALKEEGFYLYKEVGTFGVEDLQNVGSRKDYNNRSHLFEIGKPINQVVLHEKPKQFRSSKKQVELYFGWMKEAADYRTRRIVGGQLLMNYFEEIAKEAYQELSEKRKEKCKITEIDLLEFDFTKMDSNPLWFDAHFSAFDPAEAYVFFIESNIKERIDFANKFGIFSKGELILEQKPKMKQHFYTYDRAMKHINTDTKDKEKSYLCTSVVYVKKKDKDFKRRSDRVTELSLFFCEVDHYKVEAYKHLNAKQVAQLILEELEANNIPHPTEIVYSRGPQFIWKHSPVPEYKWTEWVIVQEKIHSILKKFGADGQTTSDRVRFLRSAGSVHEKLQKRIIGYSYTEDRYLFDDFIEQVCKKEIEKEREKRRKNREKYLKWLEKQEKNPSKKKKEKTFDVYEGKGIKTEDGSISETHEGLNKAFHQRYVKDIKTLVALRNGEMEGFREFVCFLVRYWTLCITDGKDLRAINEMKKVYEMLEIAGKYTFDEMVIFTSSALTGFKRWKENQFRGYNYNNRKLCEKLELTLEEQEHMSIIMCEEEVNRRKGERAKTKRKKKGAVLHEETRQMILTVTKENPNLPSYKIAKLVKEKLGKCSKNTVDRVWGEIGK